MTAAIGYILLLAVGVGLLYTLKQPRWAFMLIVMQFPLKQLLQSYSPFLVQQSALVNIAIMLVACGALMVRVFRREPVTFGARNPVSYCIGGMYLLGTFGLFYTPVFDNASSLMWSGLPYYIEMLIVLPLLLLDLRDFRRMLTGMMAFGIIIAALIFVNPAAKVTSERLVIDLGQGLGVSNLKSNPLALAEMGGLIALIAALIVYEGKSQILIVLRVGAFLAGLGLAIASGSRGQVIAATLMAVLFYPAARKVKDIKQFFLLVVGLGFLGVVMFATFKLFISHDNAARWDIGLMLESLRERQGRVGMLLSAFVSNPQSWIQGLGTNYFSYITGTDYDYCHNIFVEISTENGLIGCTLYVATLWFTIKECRRLFALHKDDPSMRSTAALLIAIFGYNLFLSLKQGCMWTIPAPWYWCLIIAKLSRYEQAVAVWQYQQAYEYTLPAEDQYPMAEGYGEDPVPAR
ncbi:MAG: hypothetical protein SFY96_07825 [Planctomycetota bacterium]|nr:hypothetical protein [Planctomycetota bacterium]